MLETRRCFYQLIVAILEKYGYQVITSADFKTLYVSRYPEHVSGVPFTELEKIFQAEDLDEYIDDIESVHVSSWKIKTI